MRLWLLVVVACETAEPRVPPPAASPPPPPSRTVAIDASTIDARGKIHVTEADECGFMLDMIYFKSGSSELQPMESPILDATADAFKCFARTEHKRWQVLGNADDTEKDPRELAAARAKTTIDALVARGVSAGSMDLVSAGASQPLDPHHTPDARAKNRRVQFTAVP